MKQVQSTFQEQIKPDIIAQLENLASQFLNAQTKSEVNHQTAHDSLHFELVEIKKEISAIKESESSKLVPRMPLEYSTIKEEALIKNVEELKSEIARLTAANNDAEKLHNTRCNSLRDQIEKLNQNNEELKHALVIAQENFAKTEQELIRKNEVQLATLSAKNVHLEAQNKEMQEEISKIKERAPQNGTTELEKTNVEQVKLQEVENSEKKHSNLADGVAKHEETEKVDQKKSKHSKKELKIGDQEAVTIEEAKEHHHRHSKRDLVTQPVESVETAMVDNVRRSGTPKEKHHKHKSKDADITALPANEQLNIPETQQTEDKPVEISKHSHKRRSFFNSPLD